jgi:hypothetical protein
MEGTMSKLCVAICVCLLGSSVAQARDREFDLIVDTMESQYGTKRLSIPFLGIANLFVKAIRPAGARDIKLAVFEHVEEWRHPSHERLDDMVESLPAQRWSRFVRVQSHRGRERVHIYGRKAKEDWELLIATLERNEAVIVRVRLNPDGLAKWVNNPVFMARRKGIDPD